MLTTSIDLLERLRQADDHSAWERFVSLYSPLLLCWAQRAGLPREETLDLVQDIFALLLRELPSFQYDEERGSFRSWLKTLTARLAIDRLRRWNPAAPTPDSLSALMAARPTSTPEDEEYQDFLVRRALELMKRDFEPTTWQACWEHTVSGRSAAEVGRQLGMSEGAVYVAKSRVLRRLREQMQGLLD